MDLIKDDPKKLYGHYLLSSFGSAFASSILSLVDAAMVGQYQGPDGTAALAVIAPLWNIIFSLGLLMGIGGSVLLSSLRGEGKEGAKEKGNSFFTTSLIGSLTLSALCTVILFLFQDDILRLFGASEELLPICDEYLFTIRFAFPLFLLNQWLAAYLRNDGDPALATAAVLAGGVFNVIGDYLFVFPFEMGVFGAGLATAIGSLITFLVLLSHFFRRRNTLKLTKPINFFPELLSVFKNGFSSFFVDVSMGILTIVFNNQIMRYFDSDALAVYGVIIQVSTFVQCCAYAVGQASQPLISVSLGAKRPDRIKKILRYALMTCLVFAVIWLAFSEAFPNVYVRLFMSPTSHVLEVAPKIIRLYSASFLLLPFNVFLIYYFQSLLKPWTALVTSALRGLVLALLFLFSLPLLQTDLIWLAMPFTELLTACYAAFMAVKYTKSMKDPAPSGSGPVSKAP